ncbi:hypothetical protein MTR67_018139 [Solanum verrucosum]|uniref:Uncharacterized protein n=1 Tax=Solanum verrucosum TaxID=315347 RepID=A0AAF0QRL7_SOLVR|nr:hypothetical protein MTR67_018139 [Solanum verrucosum]
MLMEGACPRRELAPPSAKSLVRVADLFPDEICKNKNQV